MQVMTGMAGRSRSTDGVLSTAASGVVREMEKNTRCGNRRRALGT